MRYVVGNWKMHGRMTDATVLCRTIAEQTAELQKTRVVVCPPYPYLGSAVGTGLHVGAQDCSAHGQDGAYTGQVSAGMLRDVGAQHVIVGHSERRRDFDEHDALVAKKSSSVQNAGLTPIVCLGESLAERQAGETFRVIAKQLAAVLGAIDDRRNLVLAYEPIWAIGTGVAASSEQAQEVHAFLRSELARVDEAAAPHVALLYGGSVKGDNAQALFAMPDIDGALVGGASLQAEEFVEICWLAEKM